MNETEATVPNEFLESRISEMMALPVSNSHEREWRDPEGREERYLLRSGTLNALFGWVRMAFENKAGEILGEKSDELMRFVAEELAKRRTRDGRMVSNEAGDITVEAVKDFGDLRGGGGTI